MFSNLEADLLARIQQLQDDDKYVTKLFQSINAKGGVSGIEDNSSGQVGTAIPVYFGAIDTFVANPSNVSIGIIARMIETDASVLSSVQFKSLIMLSKIGEYHHDKPEIKQFVLDFIKRMSAPTWGKALEGMSSAGGYGFSVSEIIWGLNKKLQKVPFAVKTYHPSTICFEVDQNGEITTNGVIQFVVQNASISNPNNYFPYFRYGYKVTNPFETPNDKLLPYRLPFISNYGLQRIPRNKVVHITNNTMLSFGSPYGKTPVRTAHLAWQMKVFFMKQMGIAGKRQATPFIWGTAPMGQNKVKVTLPDGSVIEKSPIQALTDMLATRENDDSIVTGEEKAGYKLTSIAQQMDLKQFLDVLSWLDVQIFRAFLLPSLVMTDGSAGSRSLGDKHFEIVDKIASEEADSFGLEVINQMIKPAIEMNYGEQDDYGHFTERPQSIEEHAQLATMFATLGSSGFMVPYDKVDGAYVRKALHLPEQKDSFYVEPSQNLEPIDSDNGDQETDDKEKKPTEK